MPNVIDAPPAIYEQIERALRTLSKDGYSADTREDPSGDLSIVFTFGAAEQTLKFRKDEWRKDGAIEKKIIDDLNI